MASLPGLRTSLVHAITAYQSYMLVQDAREQLKSSQHELAAIQKQRDDLARQVAHVAGKISSGMIPDPADLTVPEHIKAAAQASASTPAVRLLPPSDLNPVAVQCYCSHCCLWPFLTRPAAD